jgi:hypothetical protein
MLFTPIVLVAALHSQPAAVQIPQQTSTDTAEGLEILRRILVDSLEKSFQSEKKEHRITSADGRAEGIVSLLIAGHQTVENSRVFHLPDAGVFFSLDAALPMVAKKSAPKDEPAGDAPRDDEWEKYQREVRGGGDGTASLPNGGYVFRMRGEATEMEIDPAAVDKLIDSALQTLARHTGRIGGLGNQETITLAVKISGGFGFDGHFWGARLFENTDPLVAPLMAPEEPKLDELGYTGVPRLSTVFTRSSSASQNLVLQVRVGDLAAYTNGGVGELRKRTRINRY